MVTIKWQQGKREKLGHILAALVAGIVFLIVAIAHYRLAKIFPYVDSFFFVIEAIIYAVIAADYFTWIKRDCHGAMFCNYCLPYRCLYQREKGKA